MPLKLTKVGGVWYVHGTTAGRRFRVSTKTTDKAFAARFASDLEQRAWKSRFDGPSAVLTFAQAAILYRKANPNMRFLEACEDYFRDTLVKDITQGAIRQAALDTYPAAVPATRNRQFIVPARAIINHAASLGQCQKIKVEMFPVTSKIKRPVTEEWLEAFCAHANPHIGALAMFMYATGARVSEALAVEWSDVNLKAATALIRATKIGAERNAHLPSPVVAALANLERVKDRPVFFYITREAALHGWNGAIEKARIEPLTMHCCRHGFATSMLQAGVDAVTVAKLGGWKSVALVLSTYGHAAEQKNIPDVLFGKRLTNSESDSARNPIKWGTS